MSLLHSIYPCLLGSVLLGSVSLSGCDFQGGADTGNVGQVSVTGSEGLLVGEGVMNVGGHRIAVRQGRVSVDAKDYGSVPDGAEVYFRSGDASMKLLVNGEELGPTKKP